jgi:putative ABC transport system permease protein
MNIGPIVRAMKHNRTRVVLIVLEIAMTLAIVTNCVNVILAERQKMAQTSGFDDDNILWMRMRPFAPEFREGSFLDTTIDSDLRIIQSIPGVSAVANTNFRFWEGGGSSTTVMPAGGKPNQAVQTQFYYSTKDIMQSLGSKIIAGRGFQDGDHGVGTAPDPQTVTIISKKLADTLFPDGNAVGRQIQDNIGEAAGDDTWTVVGVFEEFFNPFGMPSDEPKAIEQRAMFIPARVGSYNRGIWFNIRTTEPGVMPSIIPQIEKRLTASNPARVFDFMSTQEKKSKWFAGSNIIVTTLTCIIVALIAVTALGLLGLTSLAVAERTKQIGTRRALGATRRDILSYFLIENWLVTTAGLILGVVGAYALNFLLVSQVSDVKMQWQLLAGGMLLLWINGLLSTLPPALRAMAVSPSIATRSV